MNGIFNSRMVSLILSIVLFTWTSYVFSGGGHDHQHDHQHEFIPSSTLSEIPSNPFKDNSKNEPKIFDNKAENNQHPQEVQPGDRTKAPINDVLEVGINNLYHHFNPATASMLSVSEKKALLKKTAAELRSDWHEGTKNVARALGLTYEQSNKFTDQIAAYDNAYHRLVELGEKKASLQRLDAIIQLYKEVANKIPEVVKERVLSTFSPGDKNLNGTSGAVGSPSAIGTPSRDTSSEQCDDEEGKKPVFNTPQQLHKLMLHLLPKGNFSSIAPLTSCRFLMSAKNGGESVMLKTQLILPSLLNTLKNMQWNQTGTLQTDDQYTIDSLENGQNHRLILEKKPSGGWYWAGYTK